MLQSETVKKYDKYKDSGIDWIGIIPQDWKLQPLKMHTKIFGRIGFRGYTQDDLVEEGEGAITLSPTNIVDNTLTLEKCQYLSWNKYYESPEIMVNNGDILFVKTASVGKCAIYSSDELATINPQFVVFKNVTCNKKYLFYMLLSEVIQTPITLSNLGSVVGTIKQTELASYKIPIPDQSEQQSISDYLDKKCNEIDKVIETEKAVIEKLKEYKQSIITEAVTKGLYRHCEEQSDEAIQKELDCHEAKASRSDVKYKDSGIEWIGKIPQHWEVEKLKNLYSFGKGLSITKDDLTENGVSVISYGQIHSKTNTGTCITDDLIRFVPEMYLESSSQSLVNKGDFIFADTSEDIEGAGNCVFVDKEMTLFAGYHSIILRNKLSDYIFGKYLSYLFKTIQWRTQVRSRVNGIKVYSISQKILKEITVLVPNTQEEQKRITDYLDKKCSEIDKAIADKEQVIEKFTEYKKSLIYECVTGKRKVV